MDDVSSDTARTASGTAGSTAGPPVTHTGAGRSPRRPAVLLIGVLGTLVVASAGGYLYLTGGFGSNAPGAELEGRWSGTGELAACDGVVCPPAQQIDLAIDCSWSSCTVPVFEEPAELKEAGDRFTASGSIPPWHLGSCTGGGFVTGRWSLDLDLDGEALVGRYSEQTTSSCGPVLSRTVSTSEASWDFRLTRT